MNLRTLQYIYIHSCKQLFAKNNFFFYLMEYFSQFLLSSISQFFLSIFCQIYKTSILAMTSLEHKQFEHRSQSIPSKQPPVIPKRKLCSSKPASITPQPYLLVTKSRNLSQLKLSVTSSQVIPKPNTQSFKQIQVLSTSDISSKERLRMKIMESQNQSRLKVNWSALY